MSEQKRYTAQEMRDAADTMDESIKEMEDGSSMYWREEHITPEDWKSMLRQSADAEEENAQLKARLEAVVKIAKESHISREVKHRGLRLYVEVDDITIDLDMGEVVKSLNSIDAILLAARGEGGAR